MIFANGAFPMPANKNQIRRMQTILKMMRQGARTEVGKRKRMETDGNGDWVIRLGSGAAWLTAGAADKRMETDGNGEWLLRLGSGAAWLTGGAADKRMETDGNGDWVIRLGSGAAWLTGG